MVTGPWCTVQPKIAGLQHPQTLRVVTENGWMELFFVYWVYFLNQYSKFLCFNIN